MIVFRFLLNEVIDSIFIIFFKRKLQALNECIIGCGAYEQVDILLR